MLKRLRWALTYERLGENLSTDNGVVEDDKWGLAVCANKHFSVTAPSVDFTVNLK